MIDREDMLELTRRMTVKRSSMTRIAGAYLDRNGEIEGTFNTGFLKLSAADKEKNLALAKTIPFAETNSKLKRYRFGEQALQADSMYRLLWGLRSCGLKNDALMEIFYEEVAARYRSEKDYAIFMFHDRYDVPAKGTDHQRQGESENVFEYLICAICPLEREYEPGNPECGFLFPAFSERCADLDHVDIFQEHPEKPHRELMELLSVAFDGGGKIH